MSKILLVLSMLLAVGLTANFCWKNSYGRGVGGAIHTCKSDQEKNGLLCYPRCGPGYYGVGPVCWAHCNDGYHDDGLFCRKDAHIYGKGCCCTIWGCCGGCNSGYHDDGCTCRKDAHIYIKGSYGRGAGFVMGCADDQDLDAGLCYQRCAAHHKGVGPVCWGQCPAGWTDCGMACARDGHSCGEKIIGMVTETGFAVANTIAMVFGADGATKAAQKAAKVAKIAAKSVTYAAKIANYANNLLNASKNNGQQITEAQAHEIAETSLGEMMNEGSDESALDAALEMAAKADPTGIVNAAKTYVHPLCHQIQ